MTTGLPGRGIRVEIFNQTTENEWNFLKEFVTNQDGRNDDPILTNDDLAKLGAGGDSIYKLRFNAARYFNSDDLFFPMPELAFKVNKDEVTKNFHVPILVTPYSYNPIEAKQDLRKTLAQHFFPSLQ